MSVNVKIHNPPQLEIKKFSNIELGSFFIDQSDNVLYIKIHEKTSNNALKIISKTYACFDENKEVMLVDIKLDVYPKLIN